MQTMGDKEDFLKNFDLEFESTLPKDFLNKYTIIECFNHTENSYALLAEDKDDHKKVVAKCFLKPVLYMKTMTITS